MKLSLVVLTPGPSKDKVIPINRAEFVIGRDPGCQLRPASPSVSKRHCALLVREGNAFVRDLGSSNGTCVNDRRLHGEIQLLDGDRLTVGPLLFGVRLETAAPVDRPTPLPPTKRLTQAETAPPDAGSPAPEPAAPSAEDDAAALLLAMQEGDNPASGGGVPEGSTVMDLVAPPDAAAAAKEKSKGSSADTSSAARDILDRYLKRPRT